MANEVKLSIVMASFNSKKFLRQSILSLLSEGIPGIEIIVVDDASSDDSMSSICDLPIRIIRNQVQLGQAASQNKGIQAARGQFLSFFDADDLLIRNGLKSRLAYLENDPTARVVMGSIAGVIDGHGGLLGSYSDIFNLHFPNPPRRFGKQYIRKGGQFPSPLWLCLFRKELIDKVGPLDEALRCSHDNDFMHRILLESEIDFFPQPVAWYRIHGKNLSGELKQGRWHFSRQCLAENLFVHLKYKTLSREGIPS